MNFIKRIFAIPRNFTKSELDELRSMYQLVNGEMYKLIVIRGNTALLPKGQGMAEAQEALVKLLQDKREEFMKSMLGRLGYPPGTALMVDFKTGKVKKVVQPTNQPITEPVK